MDSDNELKCLFKRCVDDVKIDIMRRNGMNLNVPMTCDLPNNKFTKYDKIEIMK